MRWLIFYGMKWSATPVASPDTHVSDAEWAEYVSHAMSARNGNIYKVRCMLGQYRRLLQHVYGNTAIPADAPFKTDSCTLSTHIEDDVCILIFDPTSIKSSSIQEELKHITQFLHAFWKKHRKFRFILKMDNLTHEKATELANVIDKDTLFAYMDAFTCLPCKVEAIRVVKPSNMTDFMQSCASLASYTLSAKMQERFYWENTFKDALTTVV